MLIERIERGRPLLDLKCGLEPVVEDSSCTRAGLPGLIGNLASLDVLALLSMGLGNCGRCPVPRIVARQEIGLPKKGVHLLSTMVDEQTAEVHLVSKDGQDIVLFKISNGKVTDINAALLPNFQPLPPQP